jgi:hypothetical protein
MSIILRFILLTIELFQTRAHRHLCLHEPERSAVYGDDQPLGMYQLQSQKTAREESRKDRLYPGHVLPAYH